VCVSLDFSRSQYSSLYRAPSCEPTVLMRSIKLPPPSLIFSPYSFTKPQSHPSSIRTSILIEPIDIKLSATSYSSAVPLVYPQLNSSLPIYVSLANSLLTAIYRPQKPFYHLHTPLIDRLLLSSADSSYRRQTPLIVRRLLLSSADSSYRPQSSPIVRRTSLIIRPADPIVISLSSTNNLPPKLTWPPQKLDSHTKGRRAMKTMVMFPGVSISAPS